MWRIQVILLVMTVRTVKAVPTCGFYNQESALECFPNDEDTDFVLTRGLVSDNEHISTITMKNCKISAIDCQAFHGLPHLLELILTKNRIHDLKPCMLEDLPLLRTLNLSYNAITDIPSGMFKSAEQIKVLGLKGNRINSIKSDVFEKLTNLIHLDLSENSIKLSERSSHLFDRNHKLTHIDFSRNDMSEAPGDLLLEIQGMESLILDRCFLTVVPSFVTRANLRTLKVLILSTNQIMNLDDPTVFVNLDDLEILNLGGNAISSVAENVFAPLRKVKTIVLKQNRLKQLPEKLFQNMPKLISVDLAFNVLEKIEVTPFRNTGMKNLNISGNKLRYLPENFCQQLRDAGGRLKKFLFVPNPWKCSCLRDIMEEVKLLGLIYNSQRYNGMEAVCDIDRDPFSCVRD